MYDRLIHHYNKSSALPEDRKHNEAKERKEKILEEMTYSQNDHQISKIESNRLDLERDKKEEGIVLYVENILRRRGLLDDNLLENLGDKWESKGLTGEWNEEGIFIPDDESIKKIFLKDRETLTKIISYLNDKDLKEYMEEVGLPQEQKDDLTSKLQEMEDLNGRMKLFTFLTKVHIIDLDEKRAIKRTKKFWLE